MKGSRLLKGKEDLLSISRVESQVKTRFKTLANMIAERLAQIICRALVNESCRRETNNDNY